MCLDILCNIETSKKYISSYHNRKKILSSPLFHKHSVSSAHWSSPVSMECPRVLVGSWAQMMEESFAQQQCPSQLAGRTQSVVWKEIAASQANVLFTK